MIAVALALLQSAVPAPPPRPMILDHKIACNLFGPQAAVGQITADVVAKSSALARITIRGEAKGLSLPSAHESALSQNGTVAVKSQGHGAEYTWIFKVPVGPVSQEGPVTVTARSGLGQIRYIATGICSVASSKAVYQ